MDLSVIIPAYKKTEDFVANLKKNILFLPSIPIIVVNDDPTNSIAEALRPFENNVELFDNKKNVGFGGAVNIGVKKAKTSYVMLLNTDVILKDDSYKNAIKRLKNDDKLFAVGFAQLEKNGQIVGKNKWFWKQGLLHHAKANNMSSGQTAWAEGGSCVIDRKKFLTMKGFDLVYSPFYWEDIDLSYRAKKAGYHVFFDREIVVEHHHESTISSYFKKNFIKKIAYRNQILFVWRNFDNFKQLFIHIFFMPYHILRSFLSLEFAFVLAFFQAIWQFAHFPKNSKL